jgi:hypothetical protein
MSFYQVPNNIFNPIAERKLCPGRVVLPSDNAGQLKTQLISWGYTDCISAPHDISYLELQWWKSLPAFDWTVAITQGKQELDWILEPGFELAKKGLIILDRLTFLEPTRGRADFLKSKPLSNIIVLNPRPVFRADQRNTKDSVTSAWYVFNKAKPRNKETKIDFDVSWQRPKSFS